MSSNSESSASNGSVGLDLSCWCGMEVKLFTSKTQENPGRPFYRCVRKTANSQNHLFKWVEDVLTDELCNAKIEVEEMKKEMEEMKNKMDEAKELICKQGFIVKCCICAMVGYVMFQVLNGKP